MVSRATRFRHLKRAEQNTTPLPVDTNSDNQNDQKDMDLDQEAYNALDAGFQGYTGTGNPPESDGESMDGCLDNDNWSDRSWDRIGTPPPSPPRSPLPGASDKEPDEDEDGFLNITAEDYREYDRWFGEEQEQIDEILGDLLTEEEIDSFKMLCIRLFGHISQRNYERIRFSFRDKIKLLSTYCLHKKLARLSGIQPTTVDCCINVCHAFNGQYTEETQCSTCGAPRFDNKGKPRRVFEYLPTTPRFQGFFNNPEMVRKMEFRANYVQEKGAMDEIFDGTRYKELCKTPIVVNGEPQDVCYFDKKTGRRDIAYAVMLDGVNIMDNAASGHSSCWPIMAQNLNLPPSERAKLRNLIPLGIIPGPNQPKDFNSFLLPFVEETIEQARGVRTFDITTGRHFTLRAHPLIISGDMQAIKHVIEMKGVNAKCPCRACELTGIWHAGAKTYYIPLANPQNNSGAIPKDRIVADLDPTDTSFDPLDLPLRTHNRILEQLGEMDSARTKKEYNSLAKEYGLTGHSVLDRIPSIQRPDSYPHEFMHLFLLNHGRDLVSLWTGTYKGIGDNLGQEASLIAFEDWCEVGRETEEATKTIAASFIRPFPNIQAHIECYIAEHWAFWLVYIGPVVLRGRLPKTYYDHYLELVDILKCLLSINNTTARIKTLRKKVAHYVERFEE
ncbi:hypothetical protein RSOLAG1IB_12254 [Rhizoctonia solani AG-1 IB]|uniref:Transposase family Tnp2 protein n=1 Tax=Thanatephorus cucumeris (strain AG1-IB / isolate 7/3/14) TaxID=1108050 RepID=M5CGU4_THACB|nr:hypothetical protein BN14_10865 [Rhizoctonia solani AG-1 IB]CEL59121.1 hypothetical protein RSOLAG1IB_12254 [Rhizoctonia solani AG-1 IB]